MDSRTRVGRGRFSIMIDDDVVAGRAKHEKIRRNCLGSL